jgi:hypothetical protein
VLQLESIRRSSTTMADILAGRAEIRKWWDDIA